MFTEYLFIRDFTFVFCGGFTLVMYVLVNEVTKEILEFIDSDDI